MAELLASHLSKSNDPRGLLTANTETKATSMPYRAGLINASFAFLRRVPVLSPFAEGGCLGKFFATKHPMPQLYP